MEPPLIPQDPHAGAAPAPPARRPRWHRTLQVASAVVVGAAVTWLAIAGLALIGVWVILVIGMNNFGSNK